MAGTSNRVRCEVHQYALKASRPDAERDLIPSFHQARVLLKLAPKGAGHLPQSRRVNTWVRGGTVTAWPRLACSA